MKESGNYLKRLELNGFKSFGKKTALFFESPVTSIVGPNGSGKSNVVEAMRFVLGEQSIKSMRGKAGSDLIFKGSKGVSSPSRASVAITFDNRQKIFSFSNSEKDIPLDFDEITISREVYSDGANTYRINGSEVRLKDIVELLSSVHIGSSGHHIISQGEADRILSSSNKDRRAMVEDALGLKVYQYKIRDSERKLEKTALNMKEVGALRRELAPHIGFLKKQVEKIEKANDMRQELSVLYRDYFSRESGYIKMKEKMLSDEKAKIEHAVKECNAQISKYKNNALHEGKSVHTEHVLSLEKELISIRGQKEEITRSIGKLEGVLEMLSGDDGADQKSEGEKTIPLSLVTKTIEGALSDIESALSGGELADIKQTLSAIKKQLSQFLADTKDANTERDSEERKKKIAELEHSKKTLAGELSGIASEENRIRQEIASLQERADKERMAFREDERLYYELSAKKNELVGEANVLKMEESALDKITVLFADELREARALVGYEASTYEESKESVSREEQEALHKKIERIKIKLEDVGGGGAETMKEYEETTARDAFLARELDDLTASVESLRTLIHELKDRLDTEFKEGIEKINKEFQKFFALMFGGGSAFLSVVMEQKRGRKNTEDEEEMEDIEEIEEGEDAQLERGIEINVSLPQKKVRDLHMLSGGERSLTSIALLFAMSQVNPPPFLVLDETDAALDEANSRKYGDMLENLSKYSQLIVVTHNRETMSRAQVLYGVTIGADGASKLLSIKFDEAVQIAK